MLRARQKLGKYRIEKRLAESPFAVVYQAFDTIEGSRVALKIPNPQLTDKSFLDDFRKEVRLTVKLDHENILPVKDASFIDGHFVIAMPLGERTLADRIARRLSLEKALDFTEQLLTAVAHAHDARIIHCDIKPENLILFPGDHLRLADFGIARLAMRTVHASGSGTLGYVAPEQAMGRPSYRSDVFACGLVIYRMLTGQLPTWPFDWPPPGFDRLNERASPEFVKWLRKSIEVSPTRRFANGEQMLNAYQAIKRKIKIRKPARAVKAKNGATARKRWKQLRWREFRREYGKELETNYECRHCDGPVAESMQNCPWCGITNPHRGSDTRFPSSCPRCKRGTKNDWSYCAWCYGPGFEVTTKRKYNDKRYTAKCSNRACKRKDLMPFMRYCPWCRTKVRRKWAITGSRDRCSGCGGGVVSDYWSNCAWCGRHVVPKRRARTRA